ncbi:MAG: cell division ATP-binding protein FtsE [candidate division KSB1 bacterium]|nr:cell division ATP-binding protein FtsE [candidate division KSB1 bacterium]MDZ7304078.1 cell division ATP-binding protein FtsE [candidate division KSB1 bacterium]MDZ7312058.1 cell division ATP-binding protein FtsE [candidate division KSB1 bacterium]
MNIVRLTNIRVRYRDVEALKSVNLTVRPGEFVFLVGPSGAGKSTVLRLIYMAERPTEGQVVVGRFNSGTIKPREIPYLRRQLGIIFQDFKLLDDRNVYDNVAFALQVTGAKRREIKRKVLRALANVGLSHKRYKMPHELSGGEQQRVAIARALVNEPFILLADEPTGNLDPVTTQGILDLLEKINARGTAVLMATHNYALFESRHSSRMRIVYIENGITRP